MTLALASASARSLTIIGLGPPASGAGDPTNGIAGYNYGQIYLDTTKNPNIVWLNVGTFAVSSWFQVPLGNAPGNQ